jgi:hypothetical protein
LPEGHDHREREWRHLDTCQYRTLVHARVPRLNCPTHGIRQVRVPWAEEGARFTALFEALAIDWMKHAAIAAVAERLRLSWDEAAGIQARAVRRGLRRRQAVPARHLGIDETSFARRHEYVSVVSDLERSRVLYVADDRRRESLDLFWTGRSPAELAAVEAVARDMWEAYIQSTRAHLPDADRKIVFDRFHIAQHLNDAVDEVRRVETAGRRLRLAGGHEVRLAPEPCPFLARRVAELRDVRARDEAPDGASLGAQRDAHDPVAVRLPGRGRAALRGVKRGRSCGRCAPWAGAWRHSSGSRLVGSTRRPSRLLLEPGIETVADRVASKIKRERRDRDHRAGDDHRPWREEQFLLCSDQHPAPRRRRRRDT